MNYLRLICFTLGIFCVLGSVVAQPHPADSDTNYQLSSAEFTNYTAAFKMQTTWPIAPSPPSIAYYTRALFLHKSGEQYIDGGGSCPLCWRQAPIHTLQVFKNGSGAGSIGSTPPGINCGLDCSEVYRNDTTVFLSATAEIDSVFVRWEEAICAPFGQVCELSVNQSRNVTARFGLRPLQYSLILNKTGNGSVVSSPPGINCGLDCSEVYNATSSVTLTATAGSNTPFIRWGGSGGSCGSSPSCTLVMNAPKNLSIAFLAQPVLNASLPPGRNFDLSHWKLQIPGPLEVKNPALTTYTSQYLYTNSTNGAMVFWLDSSEPGPTSGSSYVRTELRELIDGFNANVNWPVAGTHVLIADLQVLYTAQTPDEVTVAQIHGNGSAPPLLRITMENGDVRARIKTNADGSNTDNVLLASNIDSNRFTTEIRVQGGRITVRINGAVGLNRSLSSFWPHYNYFKAGNYAQATSGIGRVQFYDLRVTHQ